MYYKHINENKWAIVLSKGDNLINALKQFANDNKIFGSINGIGALLWAELGYFDFRCNKYFRRRFEGGFELLALNGNIVYTEDEPIIHIHVVLGNPDFQVIGGHLFDGEISITGEIIVSSWHKDSILRSKDKYTGLKLWKLDERE